jgi:hypothetical protein
MKTLVLYISHFGVTGGQTRFIKDPQIDTPLSEKDYSDWSRLANEDEVLLAIDPKPGNGLGLGKKLLLELI